MGVKIYIDWLRRKMRGIRLRIVLSSVVGILNVCAGLFFVWVSKRLIDIATRSVEGEMKYYIVLLVGVIGLEILFSAWKNRLESQTDICLKNRLRYDLFAQLMFSAWDGKERFHSGDVVNRLEEDVRVVSEAICKSLPSVFVTAFQFLAAFLFLSQLNHQLAWVIVFVMPVFLLLSKVYIKRMRKLTQKVRTTDSRVQAHMQEIWQHKVLIQTLEQNKPVTEKLDGLQSDLYGQVMSRTNFSVFSRSLVMAGFATGYVLAFLWGVNGIYEGVVTFGTMTAFLQLVGMIQRPMLALLRPQQGKVLLYNQQEEVEASPRTRANLVYVPQGNTLLSGTIRENLLLGHPEASEEQLAEVLFTAAADFVYELPDGLNTLCGERGAGLSEGQAQRICIARGLLRPGSVLLLDECSSSLDKQTESVLMERLLSKAKDKTLIFITHREVVTSYGLDKLKLSFFTS